MERVSEEADDLIEEEKGDKSNCRQAWLTSWSPTLAKDARLNRNVWCPKTRRIMTTTKTRGPSWSDVKESIASLDRSELIQLIAGLYRLSKGNRDFLHARFSIGDDPIGPYKRIIEECMFPDVFKNKPIQ
jgi:hypothetical protein